VQAEVRDGGRWPPGPAAAPAPGQSGMGLQLARRVCDAVTIRRSPAGSTVIVRMSLPGHDTAGTRLTLGASTPDGPNELSGVKRQLPDRWSGGQGSVAAGAGELTAAPLLRCLAIPS